MHHKHQHHKRSFIQESSADIHVQMLHRFCTFRSSGYAPRQRLSWQAQQWQRLASPKIRGCGYAGFRMDLHTLCPNVHQHSGQLRPGVRFHCFNTTKTLHNKLLLAIITSYTDQRICAFRRTRHKHVVQQEGGRHRDVRDAGQEEPEAHRRSARGDGIPPRQLEEDPSVPKIHTYVTLSCIAVSTSTTLTSLSAWHILGIAILVATVLLTLNHDAVVAVSSP